MTRDLLNSSARDLLLAIRAKTFSAVDLMRLTYARINKVNPLVNAIITLLPEDRALAMARRADEELAAGQPCGPLHGLPFAVKDLEETAGLRTTYGSLLYKDHIPESDSLMVARLRAAGALIIGKTNVPEFGFGSQTYNEIFGPTRNAYCHALTAGGSSGGAAVALATRMLALADGSDHGGSLRNPAAFNNIFGFRPTPGLIPSLSGDAFTLSLSTLGPMARNIPDLALLLSVQAGADKAVPVSWPEGGLTFSNQLRANISGRRIGWLGDLAGQLQVEPGILALCEAALATLATLGAKIEETELGFAQERIWRSWSGLRAWGIAHKLDTVMRNPHQRDVLKPEAQWEAEQGLRLSALDVAHFIDERTAWFRHALNLFEHYDYLVLPAAQVFPFPAQTHWPHTINGVAMDSYHRWMEVVTPATLGGLPALSVPVGFDEQGRPMGMQLIGKPRGELELLQLAMAYDEATGWTRHAPCAGSSTP
ncbi:amidase [Acidocella sp.]|uniref:amidase n=1 Tax=Acidocella sp. TaxID=50710 RepID=UPI003CFE5D4A